MLKKVLRFIDKALTIFENWVLFTAVIVALVSLFANVVLRYGFDYSFAWAEELVREVIIITTFIGASAAVRTRAMIKIDVVIQLVPKLRFPLTLFSHLAMLVFGLLMLYYGWQMAALQANTFQKTIILQIPLIYLYSILPIMGGLVLIRTLQVIYSDLFTETPSET